MIVEPTLAAALAPFAPPLAFLDFETVGLAIPVWNGCHPYDQVPVQFCAYVPDGAGPSGPRLARGRIWRPAPGAGGTSPRRVRGRPLHRGLRRALRARPHPGARGGAAGALPRRLEALAERLVDLLPVVRNHVYHPDFGGGFSLKRVLPALVPEMSYRGLAIAEGETASLELGRLLFHGDEMEPEERARLRADLLAYCHQDTWGLVRLLERLRGLAEGA